MFAKMVRGWNEMSTFRKLLRVISIALIVFALWALTPYLYNRQVNEAFPAAASAPTAMADQAAMADKPTAMADQAAMADKPTAMADQAAMADKPTAMADQAAMADKPTAMADQAAMADKPTAMADQAAMADKPTAMADQAAMADKPTAMADQAAMADKPTAMADKPAGPIAQAQGSFVAGSTPGDRAAGKATVYKLENSSQILRLEDFSTTNGPDLFVVLSSNANPDADGIGKDNYLQLAALKGNQGNQNYELPGDIDLGKYKSVVIWCRTFNVVFGYAALQPAA
jgi:hypothetical protein